MAEEKKRPSIIMIAGAILVLGSLTIAGFDKLKKFLEPDGSGKPQLAGTPPTAASQPPGSSKDQSDLRKLALHDLRNSRFSGARAEALCDEVLHEKHEPVSYGRIARAPDVLGPQRPLPAVVMKHSYQCVNKAFGTKEEQSQWVIVAMDREFDRARCMRTGPLFVVWQVARECEFQADDGKPAFPPISVIAESAPEQLRPSILAAAATESAAPSPSPLLPARNSEAVGAVKAVGQESAQEAAKSSSADEPDPELIRAKNCRWDPSSCDKK